MSKPICRPVERDRADNSLACSVVYPPLDGYRLVSSRDKAFIWLGLSPCVFPSILAMAST